MPVSGSRTRRPGCDSRRGSVTWPGSVNLMALESRLIRIWRSRFSSVWTTAGSAAGARVVELDALGRAPAGGTCRRSGRGNPDVRTSLRLSWKRPASILEMSSSPSIRPDRCSALRRMTLIAVIAPGGHAGVALEHLRIAEDGVERRAHLMAEADDVAALGAVGGLGDFLGLLQLGVGALVRLDLVHQQRRSGAAFPPRRPGGSHAPARTARRRRRR